MDAPTTPNAPPRRRWIWRLLLGLTATGLVAVLLLAVVALLLYQAATATPDSYEALMTEVDQLQASGELDQQRQALESQVAALVSEAQSADRWSTVLTEQQLNGWLAMQLPIDFPQLKRQGVRDPRVLLEEGQATIAFRAQVQGRSAVLTAELAPVVAEEGWVGAEVRSLKVGTLPLPADRLIKRAEEMIRRGQFSREKLRYRWAESNGNPVLLVDIERLASADDRVRRLDKLAVREGELLIGGRNEAVTATPAEAPDAAIEEP